MASRIIGEEFVVSLPYTSSIDYTGREVSRHITIPTINTENTVIINPVHEIGKSYASMYVTMYDVYDDGTKSSGTRVPYTRPYIEYPEEAPEIFIWNLDKTLYCKLAKKETSPEVFYNLVLPKYITYSYAGEIEEPTYENTHKFLNGDIINKNVVINYQTISNVQVKNFVNSENVWGIYIDLSWTPNSLDGYVPNSKGEFGFINYLRVSIRILNEKGAVIESVTKDITDQFGIDEVKDLMAIIQDANPAEIVNTEDDTLLAITSKSTKYINKCVYTRTDIHDPDITNYTIEVSLNDKFSSYSTTQKIIYYGTPMFEFGKHGEYNQKNFKSNIPININTDWNTSKSPITINGESFENYIRRIKRNT